MLGIIQYYFVDEETDPKVQLTQVGALSDSKRAVIQVLIGRTQEPAWPITARLPWRRRMNQEKETQPFLVAYALSHL